jgi:hypothetical protein
VDEDRGVPGVQGQSAMADASWLPGDPPADPLPQPWGSDSALAALHSLAREFSSPRPPLWCPASLRSGASGKAQVFRVRPGQSMHVAGASPLAAELRRLLTAGAEPGWELHPVPGGRTPLQVLAGPLRSLSGNSRFFNLLDRSGFAYVEEVTATPDECLTDLGNIGPGLIAAVRQVTGELAPGTASPAGGMAPDGREPGTGPLPALSPATLRALTVVAAWAVAERGARTAGDLIAAVARTRELPPGVAAAWKHVRQLDLRQVLGPGTGGNHLTAAKPSERAADQRPGSSGGASPSPGDAGQLVAEFGHRNFARAVNRRSTSRRASSTAPAAPDAAEHAARRAGGLT